jgi:hypothetical protein
METLDIWIAPLLVVSNGTGPLAGGPVELTA